MAYSIHGRISYILEANLIFKKNEIIFNLLLCSVKIIVIKGIVYIQCKRCVMKLKF